MNRRSEFEEDVRHRQNALYPPDTWKREGDLFGRLIKGDLTFAQRIGGFLIGMIFAVPGAITVFFNGITVVNFWLAGSLFIGVLILVNVFWPSNGARERKKS